jgi:radical SAM superfamily enzyme YgiQ (UPF0313 family)
MNKKITIDQIKATLYNLAECGIKTSTMWIVGYPGETEKDFYSTLKLIEDFRDMIYDAEANPFRYFFSGQVHSGQWHKEQKKVRLYPKDVTDMLIIESWSLDCLPQREEVINRVQMFDNHCQELSMPNPYSLRDIYSADERWKSLHRNSVIPLVDFKKGIKINECKNIGTSSNTTSRNEYNGDFNF